MRITGSLHVEQIATVRVVEIRRKRTPRLRILVSEVELEITEGDGETSRIVVKVGDEVVLNANVEVEP